MAWRLAKSLEKLRDQINDAAPGRSKSSDGSIGDSQHASRSSDHNPWVKDEDMGVVTAIDITHDPAHGVDAGVLANALKDSKDARLKYVIWNRQIFTPSISSNWRPYTGANPHNKHVHISVKPAKTHYDDVRSWPIGAMKPNAGAQPIDDKPLLTIGLPTTPFVVKAKNLLLKAFQEEDGFGLLMEGLVKGFQKEHGLTPDGKVGGYTWEQIDKLA